MSKTSKRQWPPKTQTAYMLRTCAADMTAYGGFKWKRRGVVTAPDWDPEPVCGYGLHGYLNGEGSGGELSWAWEAVWMICAVDARQVVMVGDKAKVPRAKVVFAGTKNKALAKLQQLCPGAAVICGTATAGYSGTATAGKLGTATAGDSGEIRIRYYDGGAERYRVLVGYVGEAGIKPNVAYRVLNAKLVEAPAGG